MIQSRLLLNALSCRWYCATSYTCFVGYNKTSSCSESLLGILQNNSSYCQKRNLSTTINENTLLAYSSYLLNLFQNLKSRQRLNALSDSGCPKLLYDELGGSPGIVMEKLEDLSQISQSLEEAHNHLKELRNLAESSKNENEFLREIDTEMKEVQGKIEVFKEDFINALVHDREVEHCEGAVLEVSAGVGGQEAMLFAQELYEMYCKFCDRHGFEMKEVSAESEDSGGLLQASCIISSPDGVAYSLLRHEAGIHRVQRVPKTESRGRIHTSTASIAVIPKQDTSSFSLNPKEIKKYFTGSPGGGGQHVNKTMSTAIVRHEPTGVQVRCHATRIQLENYNRAMEQLKQILYKRYLDEKMSTTNAIRLQQTKSRNRSDKIRTYNFPNNRIVDHRIGYTVYGIDSVLSGGPAFVKMLQALDETFSEDDKIAVINALFKEAGLVS